MGFPFLIYNCAELPIEHLQLEPSATNSLYRRGATNIGDVIGMVGSERYPTSECVSALNALNELAKVTGPKKTDWYLFWKGRDFHFNYARLTCPELEALDRNDPICPVDKDLFGNAGPMLARAGFDTLGMLAEALRYGLPDISGMGPKKYDEFYAGLMKLVKMLRSGKVAFEQLKRDPEIARASDTASKSNPAHCGADPYNLSEPVKALGLGILHAGPKARMLEAAGLVTVGDVASLMPDGLLEISGMGRSTIERLDNAFNQLNVSQTEAGDVDWERYCAGLCIPLLPAEMQSTDGASFVKMIGETLGMIGATLEDPVYQKIIALRLSKLPQDRATLDEIGQSMATPVTRERIRQKEAKLLAALAEALVYDDYSNLSVHFRPDFADFWKIAALRFDADTEAVTFTALVDGLSDVWEVDRTLLLEHLPLIATILTGEVPTGISFGDTAQFDQRLFTLNSTVSEIPFSRLQVGRAARTLSQHGIETIGHLVDAVSAGQVSRQSGAHFRLAIDHLQAVADAFDPNGQVNWDSYNQSMNIETVPAHSPLGPKDFLVSLNDVISKILTISPPSMRSKEIFEQRVLHFVESRITTEALGEKLGTHGSSIKREETVTLEFLNDVIIQKNFAVAQMDLDSEFLAFWQFAAETFDQSDGEAREFCRRLSLRWNVFQADVNAALPTLMAVLTGYPYGRLGRYVGRWKTAEPAIEPLPKIATEIMEHKTLVLRGFRRAH
ncbi:MAG: hypothetical protein ABJP44_19425 [Sulfitobacter sp.]|uniref:hypothetical protein n=1 Tax=Sulfitobacter sp. TaxID=1903071 RepID=UPI00329978F8